MDMMADLPLAEIAADLYAGSPGKFVPERNTRAKAVEDAQLGAQIRALRKPSIAAW
ncbi:hypothetical protein GCM10007198_09540 [Microbacterium aerolatum]|uniref:Uncharacterized protein n=1 Tax=Microbacterium aerolatum TaxID=153731 RepID=A0A511AI89_9MICO|nr:hypothetical protein MAE01_08630 [Microbacterium aerolatum]GGB21179.1 hypothetical protein GCM10007198_09540 [Microbacterium aerolatum]